MGAVVCISHALFGIAAKGLYVAGVHAAVSWPEHELTAAQKNLAALRDLSIFEPWFLVLGLLLALAGYGFAPTAPRGRQWTLSLLAAIVLICVRPRPRRHTSHLRGVLKRPAGCTRPRTHSRFSSRARATASVRLAAPSLPSTWVTCFLTVSRVTTSSPAMA